MKNNIYYRTPILHQYSKVQQGLLHPDRTVICFTPVFDVCREKVFVKKSRNNRLKL